MQNLIELIIVEVLIFAAEKLVDSNTMFNSSALWTTVVIIAVLSILLVYRRQLAVGYQSREKPSRYAQELENISNLRKAIEEQDNRVVTNRTLDEILDKLQDMDGLEIERFTQPYIGKWMKVCSCISDIKPASDTIAISLRNPEESRMTLLWFSRKYWEKHLEALNIGDDFCAQGEIFLIDKNCIQLKKCSIT